MLDMKLELINLTNKNLTTEYDIVYAAETIVLEDTSELLIKDVIDEVSCLTIVSNSFKELKADFQNYLLDSYKTLEFTDERLTYLDLTHIARFIVWKFKTNETIEFDKLFYNIEIIITKSNSRTRNLIIVGLFEGIQNICGWNHIDHHKFFETWL
jgi:hypothetical protein